MSRDPYEYRLLGIAILQELVAVEGGPGGPLLFKSVGSKILGTQYRRLCDARDAAVAAVLLVDTQSVNREVEALLGA